MNSRITTIWEPISTHSGDDEMCIVAEFEDGHLQKAELAYFREGVTHQEWEEVADGVRVVLDEWQEDSEWIANIGDCEIDFTPTHWAVR